MADVCVSGFLVTEISVFFSIVLLDLLKLFLLDYELKLNVKLYG